MKVYKALHLLRSFALLGTRSYSLAHGWDTKGELDLYRVKYLGHIAKISDDLSSCILLKHAKGTT